MKVNFNKTVIENAPIPLKGKRSVLRDSKIHGLECRITHAGAKTFCINKRRKNGRLERITIGKFPDITVEKARVEAQQYNARLAKGESVVEDKSRERQELYFEALFFEYLEKHSKLKKKTWKDDLTKYNLYLKKPLGRLKISQIKKSDLSKIARDITSEYKSEDQNKPLGERRYKSGGYANRILALVSSVFGWAVSEEICATNPASRIKRYQEKSRERFLQPEELPAFIKAVELETNRDVRDFIYLALLTGARKSNILAMRWDQISFVSDEWTIPRTKNGDSHRVPLGKEAIEILKKRKNNYDYVFASEGKYGHLHEPRKGFQRIVKQAGLHDLRIHDLRRTLGSWQARTGSSLIVIGKTLGHRSPQATAIYSRLDMDPVRKSVQVATTAIFQAANARKVKPHFNRVAEKVQGFNFVAFINSSSKIV